MKIVSDTYTLALDKQTAPRPPCSLADTGKNVSLANSCVPDGRMVTEAPCYNMDILPSSTVKMSLLAKTPVKKFVVGNRSGAAKNISTGSDPRPHVDDIVGTCSPTSDIGVANFHTWLGN